MVRVINLKQDEVKHSIVLWMKYSKIFIIAQNL